LPNSVRSLRVAQRAEERQSRGALDLRHAADVGEPDGGALDVEHPVAKPATGSGSSSAPARAKRGGTTSSNSFS
jgi:hypothetical protein